LSAVSSTTVIEATTILSGLVVDGRSIPWPVTSPDTAMTDYRRSVRAAE
jgi:hypothetical protein